MVSTRLKRMLPGVQESMWDVYQLTGDLEAAAEAIRVPSWTVRNWVREAGGLRPRRKATTATASRLSYPERMEIEVRLGHGESSRSIAVALGRAPSTISREIKRHRVRSGYSATAAQREAWQAGARPQLLKLGVEAAGSRLRQRVVDELVAGWSPQQASCRLRAEFGTDPAIDQGMAVAAETIYRAIYLQARGGLKHEVEAALAAQRAAELTATAAGVLRSGQTVRKPRAARRRTGQGQIPDMISIRDRPPTTDTDGHWLPGHHEGDLILGKKCQSAIGTIVERASGYLWLLHLPDGHTAQHVHAAIVDQLHDWPQVLKQSLTWDRGKEMSDHKKVTDDTTIKVYFADPRSPWQRPGNENINGLLRQYFPKGTDLSIHSRPELDRIAALLNDRPRARLNYAKPSELMTELALR
jgi:IS30 family transposase